MRENSYFTTYFLVKRNLLYTTSFLGNTYSIYLIHFLYLKKKCFLLLSFRWIPNIFWWFNFKEKIPEFRENFQECTYNNNPFFQRNNNTKAISATCNKCAVERFIIYTLCAIVWLIELYLPLYRTYYLYETYL